MEEEDGKDKNKEDKESKVRYGWDENKRQINLGRHPGYDFKDAHKLWDSGAPIMEDPSERKGEDRWEATGKIDADTAFVVYEQKSEELRWIISFRAAVQEEREKYEKWLAHEVGREDDLTRLIDSLTKEREEREREQNLQRTLGDTTRTLDQQGQDRQVQEKKVTQEQQDRTADDGSINKLLFGKKEQKKDKDKDKEDELER